MPDSLEEGFVFRIDPMNTSKEYWKEHKTQRSRLLQWHGDLVGVALRYRLAEAKVNSIEKDLHGDSLNTTAGESNIFEEDFMSEVFSLPTLRTPS
jgi:hypothetical protein